MRVHSFDDGFEAAAAAAGGQAGGDRELIPNGTHTVTIRKAAEGPHKFPQDNPGDYLNLEFAPNGPYSLFWASYGSAAKDLAMTAMLAQALGFTPEAWADADPGDLVGMEVQVVTNQGTKGKPKVFINKFMPVERAAPPASKPERNPQTAAGRVATAKGDEAGEADDIPFMWMLPLALAVASMGGLA
jgi:hypothetical protein